MKQNEKKIYLDLCVCCGSVIPEGRMVCMQCEKEIHNNKSLKKAKAKRKK